MGPLAAVLLGLMTSAGVAARPPSVVVYSPNGAPVPGDAASLVVVSHSQGVPSQGPAPTVTVDGVELKTPGVLVLSLIHISEPTRPY